MTQDVSEWLQSFSKPSGYLNLARYTHYFIDANGREFCVYYEPRNLAHVANRTIAHIMGEEAELYPWFGNILVVGVHLGVIRGVGVGEWPSIMACLQR